MHKKGKKVFVGLSGGVDSSVSALLLKKEGYDVTGVFIKVWQPDWIECTWKEDRLDAMRICAALDIPFITLDLEAAYKKEVVDYMIREYKEGKTPNPDVMCNKYVKFGGFFSFAMESGADYVATGHYASIKEIATNKEIMTKDAANNDTSEKTFALLAGEDPHKDQSYFLWTLSQRELSHTLFPVGTMEKKEVRAIAAKHNLITADKKDSQGLCFIGKIDMKEFLKEYIAPQKGNVLNEQGEIIGEHDGAVFLTIGERHGFTITKKTNNDKPYYVVSKNNEENTVTVSSATPQEGFLTSTLIAQIKNVNWIRRTPQKDEVIAARARYRQTLEECTVITGENNRAEVHFKNAQSTLSPGQSLVFYKDGECLGGGILL